MKYEQLLKKVKPLPPYNVAQDSNEIKDSIGKPVADCYGEFDSPSLALLLTHSANVLPKALEALKKLLDEYKELTDGYTSLEDFDTWEEVILARAAIHEIENGKE